MSLSRADYSCYIEGVAELCKWGSVLVLKLFSGQWGNGPASLWLIFWFYLNSNEANLKWVMTVIEGYQTKAAVKGIIWRLFYPCSWSVS